MKILATKAKEKSVLRANNKEYKLICNFPNCSYAKHKIHYMKMQGFLFSPLNVNVKRKLYASNQQEQMLSSLRNDEFNNNFSFRKNEEWNYNFSYRK